VNYVNTKLKENNDQNLNMLATKEDIGNVRIEIASSKAEMIKWMFIFWIGTISVLSGIMAFLLNAYKH
jgi:hypothetical protein